MLGLWLVGSVLLAFDACLAFDTFDLRQRLPWFGHPDPRVAVPAWAVVLTLTGGVFFWLLLASDFPREYVRWLSAWCPGC